MAELARKQHGVLGGYQLLELGIGQSAIARATRNGRLHPLYRGVFAAGHTRLSARGEALAAVLSGGEGTLLSHRGAAWLWGLRETPARWDVTMPGKRHQRPAVNAIMPRVHRSRCLTAADRTVRDGIPVTALPRTLLDLAPLIRPQALKRQIETAEKLGLLDLAPIEDLLSRTAGHRGRRRLSSAIAGFRPEPAFTRSEMEKMFVTLIRSSDLPMPLINTFEAGFELDAFWPEERLAIELQSYEHHGTRGAFERDNRRLEDLLTQGIAMMPVTWRRMADEPRSLLANLKTLLAERRAR